MSTTFKKLGVLPWLDEALAAMKIFQPSSIQEACIPEILLGRDCIGGAKTGSGKTIAFAAPMLTQWSEDPMGIFGLVLTPTRELAMQIAEQYAALGANMNIRISVIVGGEDIVKQALELQSRPHFVIATPGRLADHILNSGEETICGLRRIKYLVLDEADRLLSDSFGSDLQRCFSVLPKSDARQTLLFTATVTDAVRALKERPVPEGKKPVFIHEVETVDEVAIPSTLSIKYMLSLDEVKDSYLYGILTLPENLEKTVIVFVNSTKAAELLRRTLRSLELRVASLHSQMPQTERTNSLHRFKANAARILIATDVASRGLDIPTVELVINFHLPADPDDFIHRVGRTARAGRKGDAISLISPNEIARLLSIEERINKKMEEDTSINDTKVAKNILSIVSKSRREAKLEMERENFGERRKINQKKHGKDVDRKRNTENDGNVKKRRKHDKSHLE